jgi:hypothetical protein
MVVFPIGSLTDFVTKLTMSIIGNSSLQHAERAIISASIVDSAVSVCNLDCQKTGQSAKVMMNPVRLLSVSSRLRVPSNAIGRDRGEE